MLEELRIRNLGVVQEVDLVLHKGMTAVTGETGAGKTMIVEAIRLLSGGRAEPQIVRAGAEEALIEGRFVIDETESILSRTIPTEGRSRAYIDNRMTTVSALGDASDGLVDLHAQNAHQSLLTAFAQRDALDAFGAIDTSALLQARKAVSLAQDDLQRLGGDAQSRAREVDLIRYQLDEIEKAQLEDPDESEVLSRQEELLADVAAHREAAEIVRTALHGDGAAGEQIASALAAASSRTPLAEIAGRLRALSAEIDDLAIEASSVLESLVDDPQSLAEVQDRRHMLRSLEKKYGPTLADVIAFRNENRQRLNELESYDESVAAAEEALKLAQAALKREEKAVFQQRSKCAPGLQTAVEKRLKKLSLPNARFEVAVTTNDVTFGLSANPGLPVMPIAKAASGGELSRTMLALHLTLIADGKAKTNQQRTLIFDEVDAGVGGEAAISIGKALSELGQTSQVLVVTHLPQVAAFADNQLSVAKKAAKTSTTTTVVELRDAEREIELARMLAGRPDSKSGREHARELMNSRSNRQ